MLKILSYNIEWGRKVDEAGEWIMNLNPAPDIICLQEIPQNKVPSLKKSFENHGYDCKYAPAYTDHEIVYGELTAYNTKKVTLVFSKVVELGSSIVARLVSQHNSRYTSLLTVFKHKNKTFIIINIHLLPFVLNGKRRKQLGIAIEALTLLRYINIASLIVGDYNYSSLIGRKGLIKFMATHGFSIGGKKKVITHKKWRIKHQTDYVFYRHCTVKNLLSEKVKFSDHYPIFFNLELD